MSELSDLEITRKCAEMMGYECIPHPNGKLFKELMWIANRQNWNPLADDAQAMALVRRFRLDIDGGFDRGTDDWMVLGEGGVAEDADLNRAICLCVARMKGATKGAEGEK